jgi:hypothetical protein
MTKLRQEEKKKRISAQAKEMIGTIGAEGKKGIQATKEHFKQEEKKEEKIKYETLDKLEGERKSKFGYNKFLAGILLEKLRYISWPEGWSCKVAPTEKGIIMELHGKGKIYRNAFASVGDGIYDLNAVETYVIRAENTIGRIEGADQGGVIIAKN